MRNNVKHEPVLKKSGANRAFTLAEVLITLGIIGVVAALTIPNLIVKYQKEQTLNQLKKATAEIASALKLSEAENGLMEAWDFLGYNYSSGDRVKYFGKNYFEKYFNVVQSCIPTSEKCWTVPTLPNGTTLSTGTIALTPHASFITASGYSVHYWLHNISNGGWVYIDVNGPMKGPNRIGRDVFVFVMSFENSSVADGSVNKLGFWASGLSYDDPLTRDELLNGTGSVFPERKCSNDGTNSTAGLYCAAVIITDGWQIKDDYPW